MMTWRSLASIALACYAAPGVAGAAVTVDTTPRQTLTGFGASGAWWPNDLANFPYEKQKELADFLFLPSGIHLSAYRYNLGANGGNDTHSCYYPNRIVESPMLTNGTYDFSRDQAGQRFLEYASNHSVPYITFFLNAAPSHIASNRQACGWRFTANATQPFADYIATVLSHYITEKSINISYVSPMNEPEYLHPFCDQEGMAVAPDLRGYIAEALHATLQKSAAKSVGVIMDEETSTYGANGAWPQWLPNSTSVINSLAIHNYDFPTDDEVAVFYSKTVNITNGNPPPIKFTETCCAINAGNGPNVFGANYDPGMYNALVVARQVWQYITIAQSVSFDWWTAVAGLPCSPSVDGIQCATAYNATNGFNSALVYIDGNYNTTGDYNLYYVKRTFMMKHLAHFHRPGSVRYDVDHSNLPTGVNAIASKSPADPKSFGLERHGVWNILFMNNATSPQSFDFQFPDKADILLEIIETTADVDFGPVPMIPNLLSFGTMHVTLPAQSLWTMRFVKGF